MKTSIQWLFSKKGQTVLLLLAASLVGGATQAANPHGVKILRHTTWLEETITGKVTDASGNALPGVSVLIKGTSRGTTTGERRRFHYLGQSRRCAGIQLRRI